MVASVAAAAPQFKLEDQQQYISGQQPAIRIVSQKQEQDQFGNYEYFYEQDDGQRVRSAGPGRKRYRNTPEAD